MANPTQERLRELFSFDPEVGVFVWKNPTSRRIKRGSVAGYTRPNEGYVRIKVDGKLYYAHRLAWVYMFGELDDSVFIDHIDNDPTNNAIKNLRLASYRENMLNTPLRRTNTSGVKGISWSKQKNKWVARLAMNKKIFHVGFFDLVSDAAEAIRTYRENLHKEFANHG